MIDLLRELVELESPTGETGRIRDRLAGELRSLGAEVSPEAEHLRADFPGSGSDGLGAEGGGAHARDEHVRVETLPVRAELLGAILRHPGL